jgi:putative hydrolase of the HAD superfamily
MRPRGGATTRPDEAWKEWFPGPRFGSLVPSYLPQVDLTTLDSALQRGMEYLDERHARCVTSLAEECEVFERFYWVVLEQLGASHIPPALLRGLALARVYDDQMEPFDEVVGVLHRLRGQGLRLGVLSEAWPSLELHYKRLGLRRFFNAFVVSSQLGRLKDDPLLFQTARERMALPASAILFVDDWSPHVQTAVRCGFGGAVVARTDNPPHMPEMRYVNDLLGVERLVAGAEQR